MIGDLSTNISVFKNTPMEVTSKSDPYALLTIYHRSPILPPPSYVANAHVLGQLTKQVHAENALQKSIIIMQQNSAHFEEGLVRALQSAWATFDEWSTRMSASVQETWRAMGASLGKLEPDSEWIAFAARSDQLLDPETPLRNPEAITYPAREDPAVTAVHTGFLERKKRFTRTYREGYYVLTPAGFLHEYASSDPAQAAEPLWSLFLPACTLGPPSKASALSGSHKFHLEWKRGPRESERHGLRRLGSLGRSSASAYSFRARSHADLMEWWNDIRMLCSRYLVASEEVSRQGPVMAAVRQAGYVSEESESQEGSSVEEEDEGEYVDANADASAGEETLPGYEHAKAAGSVSGKKGQSVDSVRSAGTGVKRRPSKRQQEKAPEGREPRAVDDEAVNTDGSADHSGRNGESRFKEGV